MATNTVQVDYISNDNINDFDDVAKQIIKERVRRSQSLDLDLKLGLSPTSADLSIKKGPNSIKQSIKSLILTNFYDKLFRPDVGSNIRNMLFEPVDFVSERILEESIRTVINNFEPRVNLLSVTANADMTEYGYDIKIVFSIRNTGETVTIDTFLQATRG